VEALRFEGGAVEPRKRMPFSNERFLAINVQTQTGDPPIQHRAHHRLLVDQSPSRDIDQDN